MSLRPLVVTLVSLFAALPSLLPAASLDFTPAGLPATVLGSGFGNGLQFQLDGGVLAVSAWYETGKQGRFKAAYVGQYAAGLGACNARDGKRCTRNGQPQPLDNAGAPDWLLLLFDTSYRFDSLALAPAGTGGMNLSLRVGQLDTGTDLGKARAGGLDRLGFGPQQDLLVSGAGKDVEVALGGAMGNALLISALRTGSSDAFFLRGLRTSPATVPLPPAAGLFAAALGLLGLVRFRATRVPAAAAS